MSILNDIVNTLVRFETGYAMKKYRDYPAKSTAVLFVDALAGIVASDSDLASNFLKLREFCKSSNLLCIFSQLDTATDISNATPAHREISQLLTASGAERISDLFEINSSDIVLYPRTSLSAMKNDELGKLLRISGIEHIVLAGPLLLTTLDSTLRDLAQENFHTTVIESCVGNSDKEAVQLHLKYTIRRYAHEVISLESFLKYVEDSNA